ncbi:DUF4439 domain-containing protein [Sinomonas albida]|uniref:DUF4439 domain-containing protein n=1 Tax=Sinomonas albida TaxID=369942 RepID=UPI001457ADA1|nr:DUF4439 domain-containing protein [Sinomonas albida]
MTSTTTPPEPTSPGDASDAAEGAAEGATARPAWPYWVSGVLAVLIALGTATAVALQPLPAPAPSRGELALRSAQDDAARLASLARTASGQPGGQTTAGVRAALASTAAVLDKQVGLLASRPGASPSPGSSPAAASPDQGSPAVVTARLFASVEARLVALPDVDGPTATLLASLAAGQSLQAEGIASAAGLPPQQPAPSQGAVQQGAGQQGASPTASSTPNACPSASPAATKPAPAAVPSAPPVTAAPAAGLSFADSLVAVDRAETAAAYVLETALARSSQGSSDALARASALDAHRRQLTAVAGLAAAACVTLPPGDAGFAVPSGFAADPTPTLAAVAESAAESWAQLVGAAPADRRAAAAQGLLAAAQLAAGAAPSSAPAFPGLPAANPAAN